jgi:phosphate transport system substrate-binding protein
MKLNRITVATAALGTSLAVAACGGSSTSSSGGSKSLIGAGSTLVAPLVSQWQPKYQTQHGVAVTYGAIGSGGGIAQITARTVDFGASDAPLTASQTAACKGCVQIPWALTGTDVAYHVSGLASGLHFTGPLLANIWLGKVTRWNAPQIKALNPGARLPATKIVPVYRTDGSGTTYNFTDYLSKVSPQWKSAVGKSTQVHFPVGLGGRGNSGVGGVLTSTNGAIAYTGTAYVIQNKFTYGLVQNAAGKYPQPGVPSVLAAAGTVKSVPADNAISIVDPPASVPSAYPISTFTWVLVPSHTAKAALLKTFIGWAITTGQSLGPKLDFAPLPAKIVSADQATLQKIK